MIKLIKSTFYKEETTKKQLVDFILNSEILSMHKECEKFEENFSKKQNKKYSVFVSSGSSANLVLLQSLLNLNQLQREDRVGISSLTWATNVMPIIELGLKPVAIDCELETLNVSPRILEKEIKNLDALFLTNVLGFSDKIEEIQKICFDKNVILLEDNCESLGSKVSDKLLGNFGLASTFSFFVGHHLSTIEGGMICTDDKDLYNMLKMVRAHGWERNLNNQTKQKLHEMHNVEDFYARYTFYDLSFNARPTEINGFLGNIQINYWDEITQKRDNNFKIFQKAINNNQDFISLKLEHMDFISNFAMPLVCKDNSLTEKYKKRFINDIEIRPIIAGNITQQPFYKKYFPEDNFCKNSNLIHQNGFYFPNNPELTKTEIDFICSLLEK